MAQVGSASDLDERSDYQFGLRVGRGATIMEEPISPASQGR